MPTDDASLFLSQQGVDSVLAKRRRDTSPQPKARRISIRTMELFRQLGVGDAVAKAAAALASFQGMSAGPTLALAQPLPFRPPGGNPGWAGCSPAAACLCAQDALEPVLRDLAVAAGGDLRFGTEVLDATGLDATGDGGAVTATLRGPGGGLTRVRADYLIAADGARSPVRERLGIRRSGRGTLGRLVSIYFRADLADLVRGREFNLCQIESPAAPGTFASINGTDRWIFGTVARPGRTPDEWAGTVTAAIGMPGVDVEVLSAMEWEPGVFVADQFSRGRTFLAGDAAHVMPPYAALGANAGIQDVHNLAWKIAAVLDGTAAPALLDSYHHERYAAGWFAADQSSIRTANLRQMQTASTDGTPLADPLALTFGAQYASGAVIGDGSTVATGRLDLHGQPGSRLPHRWLAGRRRSTLDLIGQRMTLLTGPAGGAWADAAARLGTPGVAVERVDLLTGPPGQEQVREHEAGLAPAIEGPASEREAGAAQSRDARARDARVGWGEAVGTGASGALLVRPDQIIAWRHRGLAADPRAELSAAVTRLLGR